MEYSIDDTIAYAIWLTRRLKTADESAAILLVLADLGFQSYTDGFWYLRKAIYYKYHNPNMRLYTICQEISAACNHEVGISQIDQAIRSAIENAWKSRNTSKWGKFFPQKIACGSKRPSNNEFISQIAIVIELLQSCKEACYERQ